jgi:hypothetical protein
MLVSEMMVKDGHPFKAGDIFYSSWGYDQTNIDWYVVLRVTRTQVILQSCKEDRRYNGEEMRGITQPAMPVEVSEFSDPIRRKVLKRYNDTYMVSINDYSFAFPWDGNAKEYTTYG